ncbi:MAG: hypothetical protein O7G87_02970 [bacterium]|nr:hypothetical protein [bacterium]
MLGLIREETLMQDVWMLPTVALEALVGIWLNRRLSAAWFSRAILAIVLVIGMKLMFS